MLVPIFHLLCHFRSLFATRSSGRPTTRPPSILTLSLSDSQNSNVLPCLAAFFSRPRLSSVKRFLLSSMIRPLRPTVSLLVLFTTCLLYTSDAADDLTRVDLGGR